MNISRIGANPACFGAVKKGARELIKQQIKLKPELKEYAKRLIEDQKSNTDFDIHGHRGEFAVIGKGKCSVYPPIYTSSLTAAVSIAKVQQKLFGNTQAPAEKPKKTFLSRLGALLG